MTDTNKLLGIINNNGVKLKVLAEKIGITPYGLANKIYNRTEFKTGEVAKLCQLLGIKSLKEREDIFFKNKDDSKSTTKRVK